MKFLYNKRFKYFYFKIFFLKTFLKKIKQKTYNFINFVLIVVNLKIILKKVLSLTNFFKAQTFYFYKLTKLINL